MIGTILNDRYLLEDEIGRGGMGVVYRARDNVLRRPVAVKLLATEGLGTKGRARLLGEARAVASLNHPNIVAIHDVGEATLPGHVIATPYIIMELVSGQRLRAVRLTSIEEAIHLFDQVCLALEVAHDQGIIHRDLKPENIILTPLGTVKLIDFGLAQRLEAPPLDEAGAISGTLAYMAPELILGREASPQADIYALGVIFYEFLTGQPPFETKSLTSLLSQRLNAPVVPPSTYNDRIPPPLDNLITRMLSRQPGDRPSSVSEVRQTLSSLLSMLPGFHSPPQRKTVTPGAQINRLVRGRLVGREKLFTRLVDRWQKTVAGEGQLLLVSGEPGAGKTRLVRELTTYAALSGGVVLPVECYAEAGLPYASFAQIIGDVLMGDGDLEIPDPVLANLFLMAPDLKLSYEHLQVPDYGDRQSEQTALVESVITLFVILTTRSPVLLFFDDLHWVDSATLSLIHLVGQQLRHRPLMIVGAYREAELDEGQPLQRWLAKLHQEPSVTQMQVTRLDKVRTRELLTTLFSVEVSWDFLEGIYDQTNGNPFFVEEVCRALVESGKLHFEGGRWSRPSMGELAIPQGLKMAIESRLSRLSPVEYEALEVAALLGREFQYETLLTVSGLDEEQLIAALEHAERAQLIEEVKATRPGSQARPAFSFTQSLIRSTIVTGLSTLRRMRLQGKVASALESAYPHQLDKLAPLLGRYFAASGERKKAADYLLRAGDAAHRLFAHEEAIKFYEQALPLLNEQTDYARAAHTYMKLGLVYHNAFQFERAHRAYEDGFALWQHIPAAVAPQPQEIAPHALRTHIRHLPTIDPTRSTHVSSNILIQHLFSGLVELNVEHEIIPDVALSWEVLEGGRKYIFHLRDDVSWSDGRPVIAGDFEFAWKRILAPESGPYPAELLCDIRNARDYHEGLLADPGLIGVRAVDDGTLIIELEGPSSYFLHLLAQPVGMPVPRHSVDTYGSAWTWPDNLVTNGPFLLKTWQKDELIHLERNPDYHGQCSGNLQEVEISLLDKVEDVWWLYQEDGLDCLYLTPLFSPSRLEHARQQCPNQYLSGPTPSNMFLALDVTRPPFDNLLVRQALAMAIEKETLANVTLTGLYPPATGGFVPPGMPGHVPGIGLPFNLERARELLAHAGYPGGQGFPTINARVLDANIYRIISRELHMLWQENLGVNIEFEPMPPATGAQLILTGVAPDYLDPDTFLRANNWSPQTGWREPTFEGLVEQARRVADQEQRTAMYRQAEEILTQQAALLPLLYGRFHMLLKPWVLKYPTSPLFLPYWKDAILESH